MKAMTRVRAGAKAQLRRATDTAAALRGRRFALLVASSVVATSAIVAGALTGTGESGALAALLERGLGTNGEQTAASSPATAPRPAGGGGSPSGGPSSPAPAATSYAGAPAPVPAPAPQPAPKDPAPDASRAEPEAGRVKHVFVISLTSPGYEQSLGSASQMPYLSSTLRPQGVLLSGYTLLDRSALANGIAAISGQPPNPATSAGCPAYGDCVYPVETLTLADQLGSARFSWRAYVQGMSDAAGKPANCVFPDPAATSASSEPGAYAATQNPFVYFHSLLDLGDCAVNDVPIEQLAANLGKAEKTPNYSFIAPTPCESGTVGQCPAGSAEGPAAADAFLSAWVPKILASPAYKSDGVLAIVFSALDPSAPAMAAGGESLRTGALLLSPFLAPGGTDAAPYSPYSLLRSSEDLFGLTPLARAGGKTKSFAPSLLEENGGD